MFFKSLWQSSKMNRVYLSPFCIVSPSTNAVITSPPWWRFWTDDSCSPCCGSSGWPLQARCWCRLSWSCWSWPSACRGARCWSPPPRQCSSPGSVRAPPGARGDYCNEKAKLSSARNSNWPILNIIHPNQKDILKSKSSILVICLLTFDQKSYFDYHHFISLQTVHPALDKIPCVAMQYTLLAPLSLSTCDDLWEESIDRIDNCEESININSNDLMRGYYYW